MERSIPHIRSIFSTSSRKKSTSDTQDLCQYERSPRSHHRRTKANSNNSKDCCFDAAAGDSRKHHPQESPKRSAYNGKENLAKSGGDPVESGGRKSGRNGGNYNTYTSKTLTEKDMKHLERHLSMKKTIRKQISRNLAQAFLDNPDIFEPGPPDDGKQHLPEDKQGVIAKTEQNVLDLLKISIDDRDSGHSSPTHEQDYTDYEEDDETEEVVNNWRSSSSSKHRGSDTRGLVEDRSSRHETEKKSSSIWKMFSPRHKGKR